MKSEIEKILRQKGQDLDMIFVFPTRVVSQCWFKKSLDITGLETVIAENYISWDMFKSQCLVSKVEGFSAVSNTIRNVFADYICRQNTKEKKDGGEFFNSIIPTSSAKNSLVFSSWISGILPQLDHLQKRVNKESINLENDDELKDFFLLKKIYTEFLKANYLFEPSWTQSTFKALNKKYTIIYPELIEDFSEYAEILETQKEIEYFKISDFKKETIEVDHYQNSRLELKNTVLQIEQLIELGIPSNEIAVSVPDIQNYTPYIKREFGLRNIPVEFRSGFNISSTQIGKLFSLLCDCVESNFSFESIKAIILNNHIPWKDKNAAMSLIDYGVKNNCAVSWKDKPENTKYENIWIESFKIDYEKNEEDNYYKELAKNWFFSFYKSVNKIYNSKTFLELQKNYFIFKETCLNSLDFSKTDDALLGRSLSVLHDLLYLESKFDNYLPENRFKFFISQLENEIYVAQNTGRAVNVFPYKVVAGTPFEKHFILNCSQKHTNIVYDKLSFLRKDKKESLGVFEVDATKYFFTAYSQNANCVFSFADHYFGGELVINNNFDTTEEIKLNNVKKLDKKINKLSSIDSFFYDTVGDANIKEIYQIQKTGFENFLRYKKKKNFSYLENEYNSQCKELNNHILENCFQGNTVKTSQSDLRNFYFCPASWFLSKILSVYAEKYDAQIFDARNIGLLGHKILENVYIKIRKNDKVFLSSNIEKYRKFAEEEFAQIARTSPDFRGGLGKPFIQSLKDRVMQTVNFVLKMDSENLDSYEPKWIEKWIEFENDGVLYRGQIDRVSFPKNDGSPVIIDYKTNNIPQFIAYGKKNAPAEDIELKDFQIPMYVLLTETDMLREKESDTDNEEKIEEAWFLSFVQQNIYKIITKTPKYSEKNREQFEGPMEAFIQYAQDFANRVKSQDFTMDKNDNEACYSCEYKNICRTVYSLRQD